MSSLKEFADIVRPNEPLAPHTWFHLGGPAEYFAEPRSVDELSALIRRCREEELPVRVLGGGSNVLVRDEGVAGVVISLAAEPFGKIETGKETVKAGGGAKLGHVISTAVREGLGGMETLVGIPGTIGGALHGNSGGKSGDIGQWTRRALVMTKAGEILERKRDELVFSYRKSSLDELVILEGEFELEPDAPQELTRRMQKQWIVAKSSQPMGDQSAGCVFKNPQGISAGMLIEQADLKGTRIGGAEVSDQHANFIIAHKGATSDDVLRLIELVKNRVEERLGEELELEIQIW